MIIDAHVHLIGMSDTNGCRVSKKLSSGVLYHFLRLYLGLSTDTPEELDAGYREKVVDWVHNSDVDAIGLLAFDAVYDERGEPDWKRTHLYVPNDYMFDVCQESEQLLPIASINPKRRDALAELDRCLDLGAVAIKTLPNSMDFDPLDYRYTPFWKAMAKAKIPLLSHTSFEHTIPPYNQLWGKPERLVGALDAGVTVIAAHCASAGVAHVHEDIDTWFKMIREHENLYGDISAMASVSRFSYIHRVLSDEVARERIILGSDFPIPVSPMLFASKIGFKRARELSRIKNPIEKNFRVFEALGVDNDMMIRGASLLRLR